MWRAIRDSRLVSIYDCHVVQWLFACGFASQYLVRVDHDACSSKSVAPYSFRQGYAVAHEMQALNHFVKQPSIRHKPQTSYYTRLGHAAGAWRLAFS